MPRFVMSNRLAGRGDDARRRSLDAVRELFVRRVEPETKVLSGQDPGAGGERAVVIFEADAQDVAAMKQEAPRGSVIIEEEKPRHPQAYRLTALLKRFRDSVNVATSKAGTGQSLSVEVTGDDGNPVRNADVALYLRSGDKFLRMPAEDADPVLTDAGGKRQFAFAGKWLPVALTVDPPGRYWGMVFHSPGVGPQTFKLPSLPAAVDHQGWWHAAHNAGKYDAAFGNGVRVGVIDTGCGPHPCLDHVHRVGAFLNGQVNLTPAAGADAQSHGTHVCGIIGARPTAAGQFAGIAPGVDLYAARVFGPTGGANQGDIANAIDHLAESTKVHLINMSLGGDKSAIEEDAVVRAESLGVLCVCAAGNSAGQVEYPARYGQTVAVSALGRLGWGPAESFAALAKPIDPDRFGGDQLFLADFSCFGTRINTAAAGVGVISTVPNRLDAGPNADAPLFAAMNGTSMASPAACGRLAGVLAGHAKYLGAAADDKRTELARSVLGKNCRDVDLDQEYQGRGVLVRDE